MRLNQASLNWFKAVVCLPLLKSKFHFFFFMTPFFSTLLTTLELETYFNVNLLMMNFQVDFDVVLDNLKKLRENCKKSWEYLSIVAKHDSAKQFKSK